MPWRDDVPAVNVPVQQGLLVIADIGGYTRYLSGVELEHSHDILADLLAAVSARLESRLVLVKLEGDAVFCAGHTATLVEDLTDCYGSFANRQRTIVLNTTCACDACRRIPDLNLKFVAHHGSFVEHEVAGRTELMGPDVIAVHRMLKNSVPERTSINAYAFLSSACVEGLGLDPAGLLPHTEHYEDIGELSGFVLDMEELLRTHDDRRLTDEDALLVYSAEVSASPGRVWRAMTDAQEQLRWRVGATAVETDREPGVGAKTHCVHGRTAITQEIVAWHPESHFSFAERNPLGPCLYTMEVEPRADGASRVTWRIALAGGRAQRLLYRFAGSRMRDALQANFDSFGSFVEDESGATAGAGGTAES